MDEHRQWLEDAESRYSDLHGVRWEIRILTCPKAACRRRHECCSPHGDRSTLCPGLVAAPVIEREAWESTDNFNRAARRYVAEQDDPEGPLKGFAVAWSAHTKRNSHRFFELASAVLKERRRAGQKLTPELLPEEADRFLPRSNYEGWKAGP